MQKFEEKEACPERTGRQCPEGQNKRNVKSRHKTKETEIK